MWICGLLCLGAAAAQSRLPSLAWRDESDSWHMLEISVITHPAGNTAFLCIPPLHQNYLFFFFLSEQTFPLRAERPVKSAGRAQSAPTMGQGC